MWHLSPIIYNTSMATLQWHGKGMIKTFKRGITIMSSSLLCQSVTNVSYKVAINMWREWLHMWPKKNPNTGQLKVRVSYFFWFECTPFELLALMHDEQ